MASAHLSQNLITSWKGTDSQEAVSELSIFESSASMSGKRAPLILRMMCKYLKKVLQAVAAFSDLLIAHRSLLVALRRKIVDAARAYVSRGNRF